MHFRHSCGRSTLWKTTSSQRRVRTGFPKESKKRTVLSINVDWFLGEFLLYHCKMLKLTFSLRCRSNIIIPMKTQMPRRLTPVSSTSLLGVTKSLAIQLKYNSNTQSVQLWSWQLLFQHRILPHDLQSRQFNCRVLPVTSRLLTLLPVRFHSTENTRRGLKESINNFTIRVTPQFV